MKHEEQNQHEDRNNSNSPVETLLKIEDVALMLNVSYFTVRDYVQYRKIPFCKINGVVRFRPQDIQAWIAAQAVRPTTGKKEGEDAGGEA